MLFLRILKISFYKIFKKIKIYKNKNIILKNNNNVVKTRK